MTEEKQVPDSFKAYEEGKHRRYNLLFAVNGGAFAIAKLFSEAKMAPVLGTLTLPQLSFGMIVFTTVMVWDIFAFGQKMRTAYLPDQFGWIGKAVLLLIGLSHLCWVVPCCLGSRNGCTSYRGQGCRLWSLSLKAPRPFKVLPGNR